MRTIQAEAFLIVDWVQYHVVGEVTYSYPYHRVEKVKIHKIGKAKRDRRTAETISVDYNAVIPPEGITYAKYALNQEADLTLMSWATTKRRNLDHKYFTGKPPPFEGD